MSKPPNVIMHRSTYDPVKAHEYYMRTRELRGRRAGRSAPPTNTRPASSSQPTNRAASGRPPPRTKSPAKARREALLAQKEALENKLARLKEILAEKVEAAKKRSGVESKPTADKESPSKKEKSSKEEPSKDKPLTAKEKREKAKKAREDYEAEAQPTLSSEVKQLQKQIIEIRGKIRAALEEDRKRSTRSKDDSKNETASKGR